MFDALGLVAMGGYHTQLHGDSRRLSPEAELVESGNGKGQRFELRREKRQAVAHPP
jgi:hypothetical protein